MQITQKRGTIPPKGIYTTEKRGRSTMSEALEILKSCDAFLEGHFLLSSGRHSGAYCQMAYLQQYPDRCAEVMKAVADKVKEMDVDVIVGPAMGASS